MKAILFILSFFTILACNTDQANNEFPLETELRVVTGINLLPESGPSPIILGNPNIFIDKSIISIYPNPVVNNLSLRSTGQITDVWILSAQPQKIYQDIDFDTVLNSSTYSETEIINAASLKIENHTGTRANLNLENLNPGYYRVFVKVDNTLMWDNILYLDDADIQDVLDFWE